MITMARKEFIYKGKTLAELQEMDIKAIAALYPARQRRSLLRGFTDQQKILLKNLQEKDTVKTHCRNMVILPSMVGKTIMLYNGKEFVAVRVMQEMLGHYLGEFALTRKKTQHSAPGIGATRSSASASVR